MREIDVSLITGHIKEMCIEANIFLEEDVKEAVIKAADKETSCVGRNVLAQLKENMEIAENERIPVCQDTGMTVVFLDVGQDVHFVGGDIAAAVDEGVRQGYTQGYLRKSVVSDPLLRVNTGDNTPAVIHYNIVPGDKVGITVAPKGFGSENTSRIYMLKPADGIEGVKNAVLETVRLAGPNACPPFVVGVGIGGDFEKCAIMAKRALTGSADRCTGKLTDSISEEGQDEIKISSKASPGEETGGLCETTDIRKLEAELLEMINDSGIGPAGLGGSVTALAVNVEMFPTHIAGLPVAVCMCCHVNRHKYREI